MNLHSIARQSIAAVNPMVPVSIQISTGNTTTADGARTPTYAPAVTLLAQVQPLTWRDIQQLDGLNIQGIRRVAYLNGEIDALVRINNQGGDLVTFPPEPQFANGSVWLVAHMLEMFTLTAGWCKAALTLQNGS